MKTVRRKRLETLAAALGVLVVSYLLEQLPAQMVLSILNRPWPEWSWVLDFVTRAGYPVLMVVGLSRYLSSGRRSPYVIGALSIFILLAVLAGFTSRIDARPARLNTLLQHIGLALFGLEFIRQRRR